MAELFENVEVNRAPRWPRLLKWTAGSVVLHLCFAATVFYVPVLGEAFNIADMFSGMRFVREGYKKTIIKDEVTMLTGGKFQYPPGYFAEIKSKQQVPETPDAKIIEEAKPQKQPKPKPTPKPVASPSPEVAKKSAGGPAKDDKAVSEQEAEKKIDEATAENNVERFPKINTQPFIDILNDGRKLRDKGELDLTGTIEMTVEADRNDDGTLRNIVVVRKAGDPKLVDFAKKFISALAASGTLAALKGTEHLRLNVKLDDTNVAANVSSEVESPERAAQMARGYNMLLYFGAKSKAGRDEEAYFKSTKVSAKGKEVVLDFKISRAIVGQMLTKHLSTGG